ncbi:hypothetical protein F511_40439 [Dorcoceras hygrometricum]|uniref:Uncharacterized protein n=1 Tax=Dorcoceras hygrometricum TaxID=472368 RepID=A0A2Z7C0S0_9LAMI|nr:hypothetical protein F511_40439 [Dorcoceras hygrometricum]
MRSVVAKHGLRLILEPVLLIYCDTRTFCCSDVDRDRTSFVALVMVAAGSRREIVRVIEEATHVWFEELVVDEKRRRLVK